MSNDLILEVEESLKQDRLNEMWKEYGGYLIAACILAVLFTALTVAWRTYDHNRAVTQTALIVDAIEGENTTEALSSIVDELDGGRKAIALLSAAGAHLQDGQTKEALEKYLLVKADGGIPQVFKDFATVLAVKTTWDMPAQATPLEGHETIQIIAQADPQQLLQELALVTARADSPWRYHAHIQSAIILATALQDYDTALQHLNVVDSDISIPQSLKTRARALKHVYAIEKETVSSASSSQE